MSESKYITSIIPPEVLPVVLEDSLTVLKPSIDVSMGRHTKDTTRRALIEERWRLWLAIKEGDTTPTAVLVTSIEEYPAKRMLNLIFCAGEDMDGWYKDFLDKTEAFGRAHGCAGMEIVGRRGWERFLKKRGWAAKLTLCEIDFAKLDEQEEESWAPPEMRVVGEAS